MDEAKLAEELVYHLRGCPVHRPLTVPKNTPHNTPVVGYYGCAPPGANHLVAVHLRPELKRHEVLRTTHAPGCIEKFTQHLCDDDNEFNSATVWAFPNGSHRIDALAQPTTTIYLHLGSDHPRKVLVLGKDPDDVGAVVLTPGKPTLVPGAHSLAVPADRHFHTTTYLVAFTYVDTYFLDPLFGQLYKADTKTSPPTYTASKLAIGSLPQQDPVCKIVRRMVYDLTGYATADDVPSSPDMLALTVYDELQTKSE